MLNGVSHSKVDHRQKSGSDHNVALLQQRKRQQQKQQTFHQPPRTHHTPCTVFFNLPVKYGTQSAVRYVLTFQYITLYSTFYTHICKLHARNQNWRHDRNGETYHKPHKIFHYHQKLCGEHTTVFTLVFPYSSYRDCRLFFGTRLAQATARPERDGE